MKLRPGETVAQQPRSIIGTERLLLRPFGWRDARRFMLLAGDWDVARMTADIPHPLRFWHVHQWIGTEPGEVRYAISANGELIGGVGYFLAAPGVGELGFWLGPAYWGRGIATEAARAVAAEAFERSGLSVLTSAHFVDNAASSRVLAKLGFKQSGRIWAPSRARGEQVEAVTWVLHRDDAEPPA